MKTAYDYGWVVGSGLKYIEVKVWCVKRQSKDLEGIMVSDNRKNPSSCNLHALC